MAPDAVPPPAHRAPPPDLPPQFPAFVAPPGGDLPTTRVFLDTQVFVAENFAYDVGDLARLRTEVERGRIQLHLTDVTDGEVRRKIRDRVREAVEVVRNKKAFLTPTRILRNVPGFVAATALDTTPVETLLTQQYEQFLVTQRVSVVDTGDVPTREIMRRYFAPAPPFEDNAEKKHEFPDAVTVAGIAHWCQQHRTAAFLVSGDKGVQAACDIDTSLLPLASLKDLFAQIVAADHRQAVAQAYRALNQAWGEVSAALLEEFDALAFRLDDEEGEVDSVTAQEVRPEQAYLVELDEGAATFELRVRVRYDATIVYDDPDATYYDREDHVRHVFNRIKQTIEREEEIAATVEFFLGDEAEHEPAVERVAVADTKEVWVSAHEAWT